MNAEKNIILRPPHAGRKWGREKKNLVVAFLSLPPVRGTVGGYGEGVGVELSAIFRLPVRPDGCMTSIDS